MTELSISLKDVIKEEGVADLTPIRVKGFFAKALIAERLGDNKLAEEHLNSAIELEE